jgi:hypothetical protein
VIGAGNEGESHGHCLGNGVTLDRWLAIISCYGILGHIGYDGLFSYYNCHENAVKYFGPYGITFMIYV